MIYSVELNFSDPSREAEWHAWYETYLMKLVSLDGLNTAQRFRAVAPETVNWEFLALYSLDTLEVYESDEYRNMGGGGNASAAYHGSITRRRNVYDGITIMPQVFEDGRVLYCEDIPFGIDLPNVLFTPLTVASGPRQAGATSLDGIPKRRSIALTDKATVAALNLTKMEGLAVYKPITKRHE